MSWFLLVLWVNQGTPSVEMLGQYKSMYDCFYAFELYEDQVQDNMQLVCVKGEQDG